MIQTTTDNIPGFEVKEVIGVVRGNSVKAKWFGADIGAALKSIVGGELRAYQDLMSQAREQAIQEMAKDAQKLKADAIINIRFTTSQISPGAAEILVYGTAVLLEKNER